ncbi:MAG: hypothetical protein H6502_01390 [Candidatus Woesearchaeota archaeon]|nr:MAG: hypothetical protein H6502_01390 [Candidatus Woesearchaeota archaeon]
MVPSDFNKELDSYLSSRRAVYGLGLEYKKKQHTKSEKPLWRQLFSRTYTRNDHLSYQPVAEDVKMMEDELEELETVEEEIEEVRENIISRFLRRLRQEKEPVEDELLEVGESKPFLDSEVISVVKILNRQLEKLPPKEMREFKTSSDFLTYKQFLEKYELIKRKQE